MRELQKDTTPAREIEQHEFVRYSLPRQKSRPEAGGFNNTRIIPVPSINVESFSINLNDSGAGSPAEVVHLNVVLIIPEFQPPPSLATETSIEPEPALSIELHENYNQIHVESNENITPVELHNGDLVQAPVTGKPTHSVTVEVRNGTITDGKLTNGTTSTEKRPVTAPAKQTLGRQIVVGILDLLVLLLLFSIFVVAVFEVGIPVFALSMHSIFRSSIITTSLTGSTRTSTTFERRFMILGVHMLSTVITIFFIKSIVS